MMSRSLLPNSLLLTMMFSLFFTVNTAGGESSDGTSPEREDSTSQNQQTLPESMLNNLQQRATAATQEAIEEKAKDTAKKVKDELFPGQSVKEQPKEAPKDSTASQEKRTSLRENATDAGKDIVKGAIQDTVTERIVDSVVPKTGVESIDSAVGEMVKNLPDRATLMATARDIYEHFQDVGAIADAVGDWVYQQLSGSAKSLMESHSSDDEVLVCAYCGKTFSYKGEGAAGKLRAIVLLDQCGMEDLKKEMDESGGSYDESVFAQMAGTQAALARDMEVAQVAERQYVELRMALNGAIAEVAGTTSSNSTGNQREQLWAEAKAEVGTKAKVDTRRQMWATAEAEIKQEDPRSRPPRKDGTESRLTPYEQISEQEVLAAYQNGQLKIEAIAIDSYHTTFVKVENKTNRVVCLDFTTIGFGPVSGNAQRIGLAHFLSTGPGTSHATLQPYQSGGYEFSSRCLDKSLPAPLSGSRMKPLDYYLPQFVVQLLREGATQDRVWVHTAKSVAWWNSRSRMVIPKDPIEKLLEESDAEEEARKKRIENIFK